MRQFRWTRSAFFFSALLFITSCSSFPLPDNPWQSLLVISRDVSSQTGDSLVTVSSVVLYYRNENGKKGRFTLSPGKKPVSYAMDPGAYTIERYTVNYQRKEGNDTDTWKNETDYRLNFYIEKNTVIMFSKSVRAVPVKNRNDSQISLVSVNPDIKNKTLSALRKNDEFQAWSDYDLINFQ